MTIVAVSQIGLSGGFGIEDDDKGGDDAAGLASLIILVSGIMLLPIDEIISFDGGDVGVIKLSFDENVGESKWLLKDINDGIDLFEDWAGIKGTGWANNCNGEADGPSVWFLLIKLFRLLLLLLFINCCEWWWFENWDGIGVRGLLPADDDLWLTSLLVLMLLFPFFGRLLPLFIFKLEEDAWGNTCGDKRGNDAEVVDWS